MQVVINIHMQTDTVKDNLYTVNKQTNKQQGSHMSLSLSYIHMCTHTHTHTHHLCSAPNQLLSIRVFLGAQPISFQRDTALVCKSVLVCVCAL